MKKHLLYYIVLIGIVCACESDPHWKQQVLSYTDNFSTGWSTANVCLNVDEQSNALAQQIEIAYSLTEDFSTEARDTMARNELGQWIAQLTGLQDSSTYYVRYYFTPTYLQPEANLVSSFQTTPLPAPSVVTKDATDITATTAKLHASSQIGASGDAITERGFYYSLLREGTYERKQINCGSGTGNFTAKIEYLRANATYYFVAYAINKHGIAYGDTLQFNTLNPYQQ